MLRQETTQPGDGVGVEVVGGLVEKQRGRGLAGAVRRGEEDLRQLHAATLTTGEGVQRLIEDAGGQAEVVADLRGLGVGLVAAEGVVLLLQAGVLADRGVPLRGGLRPLHDLLLTVHRAAEPVEPAGGEHTVTCRLVDVALAGVLRQVADLAGGGHRATVGLGLPCQDAHRGGLAGTVATHQSDTVTGLDTQMLPGGSQEGAGADANFEVIGDNHKGPSYQPAPIYLMAPKLGP